MQPKGQENRGRAKKPNAGRPKKVKEWSEEFKKGILKALDFKAKVTGKTVYDVFADTLYSVKTQDVVRASLFKTLSEIMVIKESKQTVEKQEKRLMIYVPEPYPVEKEEPEEETMH